MLYTCTIDCVYIESQITFVCKHTGTILYLNNCITPYISYFVSMENIRDNTALPSVGEVSFSSAVPNFFFPNAAISSISSPYLNTSQNLYMAAPYLSSPLSAAPAYYFTHLALSHASPLMSLTNPLYRSSVIPSTTGMISSTVLHLPISETNDPPLSETSPLTPTPTPTPDVHSPGLRTVGSKQKKKDFSIMSLLANEDGDQGVTRTKETLTNSIGEQTVNSRKRKLDDDATQDVMAPAKSVKTSIPSPHLDSPSEVGSDLNRARTSSNSTPTSDSGIFSGSVSNTSTPPSLSNLDTSIARQLARNGLAQILRYNQILSQKTTALNIVTPDEDGDTHLHVAIASEKVELVRKYIRILTSLKFKLDIKNHLRQTPLHVAVITKQANIIRDLVAAGANINVCDRNGDNCIHLACKWGNLETINALFESVNPKPEFDALNYNGIAPIHLAAINNNSECIQVLVQNNVQRNIGDGTSGKTALHHAIEKKHYDLIRLLIQFDFDVNVPTFSGVTPLQFASGLQEQEIVSYLIHNGTMPTKHIAAIHPQDRSHGVTQKPTSSCTSVKQVSGKHS